ncbi:MAG: AEC family transporter, partial [Clostridia bacterium]|nr:AEC family transporter [Clostridia bacterium]
MDPQVINQLIILFLLMIVGFGATKIGFIDKVGSDKISSLISRVTMPAMYLATFMGQQFSRESLAQSGLLLVISVVFYVFSLGFSFLFVFLTRTKKKEAGVYQFLLVFSNAAYMGFPVLKAVLGEEAIFYGAFFIISFHLFTWTWGIAILARKRDDIRLTIRKALVNFGTIPSLIGLILFVSRIPLPEAFTDLSAYLASLCTPIAVIITGSNLARRSLKKML